MIAAALHVPAVQPASTLDHQAIRQFGDLSAEHVQGRRQGVNAVTLFDPQFLGSADDRGALGKRGHDCDHRQLINGPHYQRPIDCQTTEGARAHQQITDRLAADLTRVQGRDLPAHRLQNLKHARAGRVQADPVHIQFRARDHQGRANEKRR